MENGYAGADRAHGAAQRADGADRPVAWPVLGFWGIARLPTAFIPNDDQGYLMIAVQLPDGASLGRTHGGARARRPKIAHGRRPACRQVIAIAGMSVLDNSADLANAGVDLCHAEAVRRALQGQGPGPASRSAEHLQEALDRRCRTGRPFVLPPPPIQGIGNAGGFQMQIEMLGGSFDYQKLDELTQQIVKKASRRSPAAARADHVPSRRAACRR